MLLKSIWIQIIIGVLLVAALTGCESIGYYKQLISGQIAILNKKQPIHKLIDDPDTSEKLKEKLKLVLDIRTFAKDELFLPVKDQYLSFVELERPFAGWNMWATPEFSFAPKTWCYPIIGCAIYRGYFSKKDAFDYGHQLEAQGYDVYIGGVAAYSTLGWLDDPVFSTFIYRSDIRLAALIFHELSHHLLYIADDTTFNESFAIAVEQESLRRWLATRDNLKASEDHKTYYRRRRQFIELVMKYRKELKALYANDLSESGNKWKSVVKGAATLKRPFWCPFISLSSSIREECLSRIVSENLKNLLPAEVRRNLRLPILSKS